MSERLMVGTQVVSDVSNVSVVLDVSDVLRLLNEGIWRAGCRKA